MGLSVEKRGKTWRYIFDTAKKDGKRKKVSKGGFNTKSEALKAGAIAVAEYENSGTVLNEAELSVYDYLNLWMDEYCKVNLKETTIAGYKKKINTYINPRIGTYKLKNVTPQVLQSLINDMFNDGYSRNTLMCVKGILTSSLKYAVMPLQLIKSSPAIYIKLPLTRAVPAKPTRSKQRIVISREDFDKMIERFPEGTSGYLPLQLGYRCGLRLSETFALELDDFDEEKRTLTVNHQVLRETGEEYWHLTPPKYNSSRVIDLDDFTYELLKRIKNQTIANKGYYGSSYEYLYIDDNNNIVTEKKEGYREYNPFNRYPYGGYIQSRTMQHTSMVIHTQLGMPDWDYHSLRHTHCSMLLANDTNVKYVQLRMGHKNIETTLNIYAHLTEEMERKGIANLKKLFD